MQFYFYWKYGRDHLKAKLYIEQQKDSFKMNLQVHYQKKLTSDSMFLSINRVRKMNDIRDHLWNEVGGQMECSILDTVNKRKPY